MHLVRALDPTKRGAQRLPFVMLETFCLRSALPSRRSLNLARMNAAGANLHLGDLAVDDDAHHLKVRLPGATRLVVRVRNVVAVSDTLVANVAAVPSDLRHGLALRRD